MTRTVFDQVRRHAKRAIARGDHVSAERWTNIMLGHVALARTIIDLARKSHAPKPRPKLICMTREMQARIAAERAASATPSMPVMLDPAGYSPGGTPNWFLNQQRLERAGLPVDRAPRTRAAYAQAATATANDKRRHPTKT